MVLIFDLDDALYEELTYVRSGFRAVARFLEERSGWDQGASYRFMLKVLDREGRGQVFNRLLELHHSLQKGTVSMCVGVYRSHFPRIRLAPAARNLLPCLTAPLYLVTDGNKQVQARKVAALRVESYFRKVYITHRFGLRYAKPSTHCFERIRDRERCAWKEMVYVADDPSKDFVNLTPLGVCTVRVLTGQHRHELAKPGYDAAYSIRDLSELPELLELSARPEPPALAARPERVEPPALVEVPKPSELPEPPALPAVPERAEPPALAEVPKPSQLPEPPEPPEPPGVYP